MPSLIEAQESSRCPPRQARLPRESDDSDRSHGISDEGATSLQFCQGQIAYGLKAKHFVEESCTDESQEVATTAHMRLLLWAKHMPSLKASTLLTKPHR